MGWFAGGEGAGRQGSKGKWSKGDCLITSKGSLGGLFWGMSGRGEWTPARRWHPTGAATHVTEKPHGTFPMAVPVPTGTGWLVWFILRYTNGAGARQGRKKGIRVCPLSYRYCGFYHTLPMA